MSCLIILGQDLRVREIVGYFFNFFWRIVYSNEPTYYIVKFNFCYIKFYEKWEHTKAMYRFTIE